MKHKYQLAGGVVLVLLNLLFLNGVQASSTSVYTQRPEDSSAVYFTPENFKIKNDGSVDISDELQKAITKLKLENNFGIIFIPEGKYLISKTIYIPGAIRLIGYGKKRPLIVLGRNSPGFQTPDTADKGRANYMFWFTGSPVQPGKSINDANAGTFYSALSNIDLKIEDGNPQAVALRTHYAQHSFVAHCDIYIGNGKAGMFDVGNEMEDVRFFGGDYGIYTTKTSPGWQFTMIDTHFKGQRIAAIKTREAGLTIVRMEATDVPTVVSVDSGYWEKLFMEDCSFSNVKGPAIIISNENNAQTQINLHNIVCKSVNVFAKYRKSGELTYGGANIYKMKYFSYGLNIEDLGADPQIKKIVDQEELKNLPLPAISDIPKLPATSTWVNIKSLGAKGDGKTDDTRIICEAIKKYPDIYFPQGWYRVTETLNLKPNTVLIGLSPIATQIILLDNTEAFGGFGTPKAILEAPKGGNNIITGIGLSTGDYNGRAVACKWMAGENSYMNDVKFIGGHGSMERGPYKPWEYRPREYSREKRILQGMDPAWDTQHWSLWITNGGGGTFTNIWTANTFAANGVYVSNTSTKGHMYEISVEHHVRNEVRFKNVSNWKVYALQTEEENRESLNCQPIEIENCCDMLFANLYTFRVIRVKTPYPYAIRTWDCKNVEFENVHNYAQTLYSTTLPLYDINSDIQVRQWEFARLNISGARPGKSMAEKCPDKVKKLVQRFEFADGICSDSKGNIYFCESRMKRIYRWSVEKNSLSLVDDFPWEPLSLACDSKDDLLVVFKEIPQPGYLINGKQEVFKTLPDAAGTSFSGWGNSGFGVFVYSVDPDSAENTIQLLPRGKMGTVKNVYKALYPSDRWRDSHDFNKVVANRDTDCFIAPDGLTIIPECYDLARSCALVEAFPGKPLYAIDEYDKRTVTLHVDKEGFLSGLHSFVEKGEYSTAVDHNGNLYVADGDIYVYTPEGKQIDYIRIPERPTTICFGGEDHKTLFITTSSALYSISPAVDSDK